jgi:hypothetical protein
MNALGWATLILLGLFFLGFATYHLDGVVKMKSSIPETTGEILLRKFAAANIRGIESGSTRGLGQQDCRVTQYLRFALCVSPTKRVRVHLSPHPAWVYVGVSKNSVPVYTSSKPWDQQEQKLPNDTQVRLFIEFVHNTLIYELGRATKQNPHDATLPTMAHVLVALINQFLAAEKPDVEAYKTFLTAMEESPPIDEHVDDSLRKKYGNVWELYHLYESEMCRPQ